MADSKAKKERELTKIMAIELVRGYCLSNGISLKKLNDQQFEIIYSSAVFLQPSDVEPRGLVNDIETQPVPTLVISNKDGELTIEQTEHTKKYLMF